MSKPRPFIRSFGGLTIILIIAAAVLGINNYRGHRTGFNLPFATLSVTPIDQGRLNTFQVVSTAEDFAKLCSPIEPSSINWTKQLAFVAFSPSSTLPIMEIRPTTVLRNGPTVTINYQLAESAPTSSANHLGTVILIDRAKLIASSDLQVNLTKDQTATHTLTLSPNQI